jgi:hypothetical protein
MLLVSRRICLAVGRLTHQLLFVYRPGGVCLSTTRPSGYRFQYNLVEWSEQGHQEARFQNDVVRPTSILIRSTFHDRVQLSLDLLHMCK